MPDSPPAKNRQKFAEGEPKGRENIAEVECIARYLQAYSELRDGAEGAWIILTPYKNQVALLGRKLPDARRQDRIMTVHASQGREWDTVFLSVVDGHFNLPWFTDSTKRESGGLYVMNTAVSRARHHLTLVCNKAFWEGRPDAPRQLIARLLAVGG